MRQISKYLPEMDDKYFIDRNGKLYDEYGNKELKSTPDSNRKGYVRNSLLLKDKTHKTIARHRLVMICYEYREDYAQMQVNHKDGNKSNNCYDNLEWCTNRENRIHACKNNLCARLKGEENPAHKLTEKEVLIIIDLLLEKKMSYSQIAKEMGCSKSTISAIKNKRNWRYLTENINFN